MAKQSISTLKNWFKKGLKPLETQFADWLDSYWHKDANDIPINSIQNLQTTLNDLASNASVTALDNAKEDKNKKGVANGYAALDGTGKVPSAQLPSYVDDVLEFANLAAFPVFGESGKIFIAIDTNLQYRWSGSVYVLTSSVPNNSSETVAGIVEEANDAEVAAGTSVGGTGAKLFISPTKLQTWWTAVKNAAIVFSSSLKAKQISGDFGVLVDGASIAWDANAIGNTAQVTLGGNRTLAAITNPLTGARYTLRVVQDATGGRTLAFNAAYTFPNNVVPFLNNAINGVTVYEFVYDGANFRYTLPNGSSRFADVYIQNQSASAGLYKGLIIDENGKIVQETFLTYNPTTKQFTVKGLNTLSSSYSLVVLDGNDELVARFRNDKALELGGTSAILEVNPLIESGNAAIRFKSYSSGAGVGYRLQDDLLNDYLNFRSLVSDRGITVRQPIEYDFGQGEKRITLQKKIAITDNVNNGQTVLFELTVADGEHFDIKVLHADATATDHASITALGVDCADVRKITGTNIEGVTSISNAGAPSRLPTSLVSGNFNWNIDTVNQKIQYRFQNCAAAKIFEVWFEVSYVKRVTPSA